MLGFEALQLPHQRVELDVGDLGIVEDVVPLLVMANETAQLVDAIRWRGHRVIPCEAGSAGLRSQVAIDPARRRSREDTSGRHGHPMAETRGAPSWHARRSLRQCAARTRSSAPARAGCGARAIRRWTAFDRPRPSG